MSGVGGQVLESDEFLVQVCGDHIIYAEKAKVRFDFKNIRKIRIVRDRSKGAVSKITYRVKDQLGAFQIDGFSEAEMEELAGLLRARSKEFSIKLAEEAGA
jgi:preprotein translocase subunit SecD